VHRATGLPLDSVLAGRPKDGEQRGPEFRTLSTRLGSSTTVARVARGGARARQGCRLACFTANHLHDMVIHMKTTLTIDDSVMARLRRESARTGRTMSELVETALRRLLQARPDPVELQPLPSFESGGALVDVADREALYRAMEGR
jgi:hypothetical protein